MTAVEILRERVVPVPIDVLWSIVEPAETVASWLALCERCETMDGSGLGRRQRMFAKWGRRRSVIEQEIVRYEPPVAPQHRSAQPPARLVWRHTREEIDGRPAPRVSRETTVTIELQSTGIGTKVSLRSRNVAAGWWQHALLRFVAAPRIARAFDRALDTLSSCGD